MLIIRLKVFQHNTKQDINTKKVSNMYLLGWILPPDSHIEDLTVVLMTASGDGASTEVTKSKWSCWRGPRSRLTGVLLERVNVSTWGQACAQKGGHVRRQREAPSASWGERPQEKAPRPAPWSPSSRTARNRFLLSPDCGPWLQQPQQTHNHTGGKDNPPDDRKLREL